MNIGEIARRAGVSRSTLGERRVDGAILMEIRLQDDRVAHLVAENFPAVCIGRTARPEGDTGGPRR